MSKYGSVDRRQRVKALKVSVRDEMDRIYPDYLPMDSRDNFELDVFVKAKDRLDEEDREYIVRQQKKVDSNGYMSRRNNSIKIRGFGQLAMLEVLAKLGIFLNAVNR